MSHLSIDRLAALADEQPTAVEERHLATCAECTREVNAHRALLAMAGQERDATPLPLTRWDAIAERLRAERVISTAAENQTTSGRAMPLAVRVPMQIAAALVLIASGIVMGRASTGAPVLPGGLTGAEPESRTASLSLDSLPTTFASVDEAARWRNAYADAYQRTVSFLAANDSGSRAGTPAVMRARLSALDRVSRTMREALNDAPYDPVINDFYLNSFGQREATLRQLNTVLPQGVKLNSF